MVKLAAFFCERELSEKEIVAEADDGPDVNFLIMARVVFEELRCHVVWASQTEFVCAIVLFDQRREAEVCQLDLYLIGL